MDRWARELRQLDQQLRQRLGPAALGERAERRRVLQQVGRFRTLNRMAPQAASERLGGRSMVGVDGSINSFGGEYPYYVALLRAAAVPTRGEPVVERQIHAPVADPGGRPDGVQGDALFRRQQLARLEAEVACRAMADLSPALVVMDGPLVRFDKEARNSFNVLATQALERDIILVGVIENLESRAVATHLARQGALPAGWEGLYDRELLWDMLDYAPDGLTGEVLEMRLPLSRQDVGGGSDAAHRAGGDGETAHRGRSGDWLADTPGEPATAIRRFFMRAGRDPGVIGLDLLDRQAEQAGWVADYLFTLTPEDGRGIPVWLDMVDRQVRITEEELTTYVNHYLSAEVRQKLLIEKRRLRPGF